MNFNFIFNSDTRFERGNRGPNLDRERREGSSPE